MRRLAALALVALVGCSRIMGMVPAARPDVLPEASPMSDLIVRAQLDALIGKEPGEAKRLLVSYGHDGERKVAPGSHHYDGCKENRVCDLDVAGSGMGLHDPITLYVNPALMIAAPPP